MSEQHPGERRYDPEDTTLNFVNRPDDLDPFSPEDVLRAEMSCGHAVTPESLIEWCRSLLDQGQFKFKCPALTVDGELCGAEWPYTEVRRLAVLTPDEMQQFEEKLSRVAATRFRDFKATKQCPGCKTYVEREDLDNLCFDCTICEETLKPTMQFCWQCLRPWKGRAPRSDRCDNDNCTNDDPTNQELELLRTCGTITLPEVAGVGPCPSIRACPTCGKTLEHDTTNCKNILCPRCQVEFCFVCLKLTRKCLETSSYYVACSSGIAPRQTTIPTWN